MRRESRQTRTRIAMGIALMALALFPVIYLHDVVESGAAAAAAQYFPSGMIITDGPTGGDCTLAGTWDASTSSCTLTTDLVMSAGTGIQIKADGITLDGNGHALGGSGGDGVYFSGRTGVTVRNLSISGFSNGINADTSQGGTIAGNTTVNNDMLGINIGSSKGISVDGNHVDGNMMGVGLSASSGNTLSGNIVTNSMGGDGISLDHSDNNQLKGNSSNSNMGNGLCIDAYDNGNLLIDNSVSNNMGSGIFLHYSDGNTVTGNNSTSNQGDGISLDTSSNNTIFRNDFVSNAPVQAVDYSGAGNIFNLPAPSGGNFWSDWTSPDSNSDGFVDSPYVFPGGQDNLPWTTQDGWCGLPPDLALSESRVYWASYSDYTGRLLSVDYHAHSSGDIFGLKLVGSTSSEGVSLATVMPDAAGNFTGAGTGAGVDAGFTLRYAVPAGVIAFQTTTYATEENACGAAFDYPGPFPAS